MIFGFPQLFSVLISDCAADVLCEKGYLAHRSSDRHNYQFGNTKVQKYARFPYVCCITEVKINVEQSRFDFVQPVLHPTLFE